VDAYSGTADERAADLLWALEDDTIKAIFCSRGGYGSMHLLNRIPLEIFQKHPKWLIGHGDITMLLYVVATTGTLCIHGPMGIQIANQQEPAITITHNLLMGIIPQYVIPGNPYNRCGHAEGILVGGNLSSYAVISGSRFQLPENQDFILFIEEVEESLHTIDRLFYMLRLQNSFERVKGVIFGGFNSIRYDLQFGSVEQMLLTHLHDLEIPVCCGFPVGSNSCIPLIEGAPCSLTVTSENSVLTFNIEGTQQTYHIENTETMLLK
jgi:muramoyltetrapeptide carboxypeptidase